MFGCGHILLIGCIRLQCPCSHRYLQSVAENVVLEIIMLVTGPPVSKNLFDCDHEFCDLENRLCDSLNNIGFIFFG